MWQWRHNRGGVKICAADVFVKCLRQRSETKCGEGNTVKSDSARSSCYLQGATVGLLHNHLHVVQDKVKSHTPDGLHRLLHESAKNRSTRNIKNQDPSFVCLSKCGSHISRTHMASYLTCLVRAQRSAVLNFVRFGVIKNEGRAAGVGMENVNSPFHIFYNQIQHLQIFVLDQISAVFHHLQDVLLHGF